MAENHQNSRPEGDDISLSGSKSDRTRDWVLIQPQGSYQDTATTESTNERSLPFSTGNTGMKKQLNQNAEHLHEQSLPCDKTDLTKQTKEHPYPRDNRHSQMHTRRLNMKSTRQTADVSRDHGFFKRGLEAIVTLAIETLGNHDSKIRIADKDLESTKLMISDNDDKNNPLLHEANAKDDKLSELEKHRKQYITYLKCRRDKLFHMYEEQDFGLLNDVRKNFGIECRRLQSALPIYARRDEIVHLVKNNQVCVIIGETGSGKSTQLVQYLYHAGIAGDHFIACTQPRKIAAISLATYVSSELASRVGRIVGYHVGMKTRLSAVTRLVYMTDHTLLNECLHDENLESYSCVIIDEAHERSIYTDLLLGMLKEAMLRRPELKVIVTSATINPATFVAYFGGAEKCPVMYVSGRTYPVNVVYDESESNSFPDDYELKAVNKAIEIHQTVPIDDGDMLVFLTSPLEVDKSCDRFRRRGRTDDHICLPLYGSLQVDEQQLVFQPPTKGKRKVVFATNCAETSITIPGIKYVIDTGVVKEMRFDSKKNMNTLSVVAVSQSSADQRKGRAGRTGPGICNRLFSENDFQTMDKMGKPEILRVHLGQGLLTLLELGVNPTSFDFVESPSVESIENAMHSLRNIGAVSGTEITDLGKWVAKLQVEPRLGIIIKHGLDEGIPIEGIVIAACCTTSGIFFRAGSDEEKKKADLQKLKFCHEGGDLLSMLNAYREWKTVEERKKGQWCRTNSINGKAMKLVNDMVIDILALLRKTMKLDISNELSTGENVDEIVQKLIFQCMRWNICCYLGHEKAGYLTCDTHQRVRIHPSSSVLSLGVSHKWVVFSQIIQTSDSFITNVTPVPDTEIEQALADNVICFDNDIIESKKVSLAVKVPLGSVAQRNLVGAMHRNRRQLEATISAALSDTLIILDWKKENSEMDLYCLPEYKEKAREMFLKELATVTEPLLKESREEGIGHHASGTRVVIEAGIAIRDILTPDQYRCVHVKLKQQMQRNLTENDLKRMMPSYEHIECVHTLRGNGILVTFCHATDAAQATEKVNADGNSEIILVPERHVEKKTNTIDQDKKVVQNAQKSKEAEFTLRANWCRRPSRGFCYVHFENQEDEIKLLPASDMLSQQHNIRIKKNAKAELMIHDLKYDADENELVQQLASAINMTLNGRNDKRIRVVIPRQNVPQNVNETSNIRGRFTEHICQNTGLDRESFQIDIKDYKAQTARNIAFIRFRNPEDCQKAASCLDSGFQLDANMPHTSVTVSMELRSSVHIHKAIFAVTKEELEGHITEEKESNSTTTFVSKVLKSGHTVVDINSESLTELAKASRAIHRFIEAETLDGKFVEPMFTKSGRYQALQIEKKYECVIFMNQRTQTLKVHGPVSKRQLAVKMILSFLNQAETAGKNEKQICLKGKENPVGLMKCIISKYGIDLEGLRQECDLLAVSLNVRSHVLSMSGTDENISRAMIIIEKIKGVLSKTVTYPNEQADCPICLCPVDPGDVSHLEYCGHPYCTDCLSTLVQNAIQDKAFPIECAADDCGKPLVIKDINAQIKRGNITWNALTTASLECFVTRNNSKFRYCITPDCPMVYPVTTNGMEFKCSQCQTHICTTCHIQYHYSLTCAMYNSIKHEKDSTEAWVKLDPSNRKRCPKCKVGIEKNGGCNHMTCPCGAHICWKCLRFFASPNDCYSHLGQCY